MRRRAEARGQHEIVAAGQLAHVGAVLVHDGEALDALVLRPGLVDEDDAGVEIALLAGEPLIDRVGDDVARRAANSPASVKNCSPVELLAGEHVPQPELAPGAVRPAASIAADDQRLGVDRRASRRSAARASTSTICSMKAAWSIGRNRPERFRSAPTTSAMSAPSCAIAAVGDEVRNGDRHRLDVALGDVELNHRVGRARLRRRMRAQKEAGDAQRRRCIEKDESVMGRIAHAKAGANRSIHPSWVEIEDHVAPPPYFSPAARRAGTGRPRARRCRPPAWKKGEPALPLATAG